MNASIPAIIIYFIVYIAIHSFVGWKLTNIKKELETKPGNIELMSIGKKLNFLFRWFPAIYLIFLILMFYFF